MADYIKRTDVQDVLNSIAFDYLKDNTFQCDFAAGVVTHLKDDIAEIPAADVVEVKHGKWEYDPDGNDWGLGAWRCSLCQCKNDNLGMGKHINPYQFAGSKYCPNCGAKMGGENNV